MLDLAALNPQQRDAVTTLRGPVMILAGAGTGKTKVITSRIANLIRNGAAPESILAVTFTNKAAREMQERVAQMLPKKKTVPGKKKPRPTISTFHSLCVRILRKHIDRLGYRKNFVIYNQAEQIGMVKKILTRFSTKDAKPDPFEILTLISRAKNAGGLDTLGLSADGRANLEYVMDRYQSSLKVCNAVDFDDLIGFVLRLFDEQPEVLQACRDQYRFVMVDEYQDTNATQFRLVNSLTSEHRNLCVVGDDDQSIYSWRGADVTNLLDMEKHYPEVKIVKLEQNYRSTNTILKAANSVIKNNARRQAKELWSDKGTGEKLSIYTYETDEEEANEIVDHIEANRIARNIPWIEQAILFRTNQQSRMIETALRQRGVRYHLVGGQSFFDRREIRDFIAYLKVLVNPHDDNSLLRIANTPPRGMSDATMERLLTISHDRGTSVYGAVRHTDVRDQFITRTKNSIENFAGLIEESHHELSMPREINLAAWLKEFFTDIGYFQELRRSEKDEEAAENRIRNLLDLMASLGPIDEERIEFDEDEEEEAAANHRPVDRLQTFLEEITLDNDREDDKETKSDAVTLITMHSCKGLEFPHVFIVGVEEGLIPHSRSKVEGTLDEERRLFYVALTRAQISLMLTHCLGRKRYGEMIPSHPSQFLKELPEELVERIDAKSQKPVAKETSKNFFAAMRAAIGE